MSQKGVNDNNSAKLKTDVTQHLDKYFELKQLTVVIQEETI